MLLKFFKQQLPSVFSAIIVVGVLSWLASFINPHAANGFENYQMPLYSLVAYYIPAHTLLSKLLAFSIVIVNGIFLVQLNTRFILIKNRTYLPALFYILVCSGINVLQGMTPPVFASFFIILATSNLFASVELNTLDRLFKSSFFVAIAGLFYLPSFVVLFLLFLGIVILNIRGVRPWFAAIAGFATPLFFTFFYFYFFADSPSVLFTLFANSFNFNPLHTLASLGIAYYAFAGFLILLALIGVVFLMRAMTIQKIIIRKYYSVLLWLLFGVLAVMISSKATSVEAIFMLAIPLSFILSFFFNFLRNRFWSEFLFLLFVVGVLSMQLITMYS